MRVFEYQDRHVAIRSFGDEIIYDPTTGDHTEALGQVESLAKSMGAKNVLLQLVANDKRGRFEIRRRNYISRSYERFGTFEPIRIDGVILTRKGDAVAFMTRDCPTLILYSTTHNEFAMMHVWRNSVQGLDINKPDESVIHSALKECLRSWKDIEPSTIRAVLTLGISGWHFNNERYAEVAEYLRGRWGERAAPSDLFSPIDLYEVVVAQLKAFGVRKSQVITDGLDTFSDKRLSSKRAGRTERHNLVIALYKQKV